MTGDDDFGRACSAYLRAFAAPTAGIEPFPSEEHPMRRAARLAYRALRVGDAATALAVLDEALGPDGIA
jgi:hypothetical protein